MGSPLVTGEVVLPAGVVVPAEAVARVRLLDTSLADAPAQVVAEQVIESLAAMSALGRRILFELHGSIADSRGRYSVQVHVDMNADGRIDKGDCLSVQSYPVITSGYPSVVRVETVLVR